jgi:hypothetical protein
VTTFKEIWPETIRHVHAILEDTEIVRYTRPDGATVWVESVHIGLIEPTREIHHVEVYGTTEDGGHAEDRFLEDLHEVPDEIAQLLDAAELTRLMSAVIDADHQAPLPLVGAGCSHPRWETVCALCGIARSNA